MHVTCLFKVFLTTLIPLGVSEPFVTLSNGQIRGRVAKTIQNTTYYAFEKIPYASPPIGKLRFQPPIPPQNWGGVLDTSHLDAICYQLSYNKGSETEDCLFINVFTPSLPNGESNPSLAVMFFIHGGGFVDESSLMAKPDLFIENGVILVTINYRLGPFGFLSTQDNTISGNNGLKDQHLAIKWTNNNIVLFGGDSNKITIFGHSAGSASVGYHLLNEKSKNLFRGAICQSGSFLSPWAYQRQPRKAAFTMAAFLNQTFLKNNNSLDLLEFLQNAPAGDIKSASQKYYDHVFEGRDDDFAVLEGVFWAPVLETENKGAFLTEKMYELLRDGNVVAVPLLIGMTSEESLSFHLDEEKLKRTMKDYDENLECLVPNDMRILDKTNRSKMGQMIRDIYTKGQPFNTHLGDGIRFSSDNSYSRSIIKHAELFSKFANTYFYVFSYKGKMSNVDVHYDGAQNVGHGEDLNYIFCCESNCRYSEEDQITQKRLLKIWTDFAKYQNPTPKPTELLQHITWPSISTNGKFFYVDIGKNLTIRNYPKKETYQEWEKLYNSLGYNNFDTY